MSLGPRLRILPTAALASFAVLVLCATNTPDAVAQAPMNTLTTEEAQAGWRLLFDGRTLEGWRGFRRDDVPAGWRVVDGTLTRVGRGGDLITTEQFGDFELMLEWMIEPGGNSGIMYRVSEEASRTFETGPEMQVLDDARHPDGRSRLTAAGSNFGLYAAPEGVVKAAGEWNAVRIAVRGAAVQYWLNGTKTVDYELWSSEWEELVAASKFAEWPTYGRAARGHIALQDHGDRVAFRNIKIRELPAVVDSQPALNKLTEQQVRGGWQLLFDGATLDGWRGYRQDRVPDGWRVVDGALTRVGRGGDIITTEQFGDFELILEWKVAPGGNSGIFFRVTEEANAMHWSGPEMQVLDDALHADRQSRFTAAGSNYALHPAPEGVVKPAGEWNVVRIVVQGAHVEHWLNGTEVVEYELWSPEWEEVVAASKFGRWPMYGRADRGHIGLQGHTDEVAYRSIKLREIG